MSKLVLRHFAVISICWAASAIASDVGTIDKVEREFLLEQLEHSKKDFLASIAGLTQAQWTFKPSPTVWSVEECAEHIILAEDFLFNAASAALKTPAVSRPANSTLEHDRALATQLLDRSWKAAAPAPIVPTGKIATPADAARIFIEKRDRHID